ncbi:MAG: YeeE/YedE family protein [Nitratireductor sp.]|nr:YeeE/YedE family protein [Nitratireductor sp.]
MLPVELSTGAIAALGGLAGGIILGIAARWGRFCTLGAIEDVVLGNNADRLRMWALAIGIAALASFLLEAGGIVNLRESFYLAAPASVLSTIVGAILFGLGMAFVGTCGFGMLARIGGGDLKSIVSFLVMGVSAYAAVGGATGYLRVALFPMPEAPSSPGGFGHAASEAFGIPLLAVAGTVFLAALAWALSSPTLRTSFRRMASAVAVGLVIAWGWVVTGYLARSDFEAERLASYTFSVPLGETLVYFMTMTGASLNFGIGAVAGVVIGAFLTAIRRNEFRWEACDDAIELRRQMIGGFLMGTGGVLAQGCTVGQGLSAASLLAWSAPLALAGIFIGAWLGLQYLVTGSILDAIRALTPNWFKQGETG